MCQQNDAEAVVWYRKAAEQGDAQAQFSLGLQVRQLVRGVPEDYVQAYAWYNIAAAQGAMTMPRNQQEAHRRIT